MLFAMPPRRSLRVLHTADVHLDGDVGGTLEQQAAYRERGRRVLQRIVDRALDDEVDLLLIAGDLFDHNRVPDATIAFVRGELDRLRQPVVILPGNHDALYSKSIYDRHDFSAGAPHVHVIRQRDGETLDFPELQVSVWGRAMEEHVSTFQPLGNIPRPDDRRWSIAMGHGFFYPERQRPDRSSPIFAEEIRDAGWDYFALGHHHLRTDVSQGRVAAHYPGAPLEGGSGHADGALLRIDFSADDGIRVSPRRLD
ncbi:MAG TPA: DNA repair exonuclease [Patescibacteria group bacterium]|nr:DNA repair exonuclease [Patescibacteria group bacterium]